MSCRSLFIPQFSQRIDARLSARRTEERVLLGSTLSETRLITIGTVRHLVGSDDAQQFLSGALEGEDGRSEDPPTAALGTKGDQPAGVTEAHAGEFRAALWSRDFSQQSAFWHCPDLSLFPSLGDVRQSRPTPAERPRSVTRYAVRQG